VLAVVVMPWCAGGDRAGSVFKRSLKNIYWSTTLSIPVAVAWGPLIVLSEYIDGRWFAYMPEMLALAVACLLLVLPLVLFVRILIVGAGRYVGETVGPAFGPREPRCDECGYLIIGLPMEAKCPECATPVRDSLPGGRRKPTEWEESEFGARAVVVLLRMQWRVLRDADFFKELRVQSGLAAARHFWWASFLLIVLILLAVLRLAVMVSSNDEAIMVLAPVAVLATCVPFVAQAATMLITCFQAQSRLGIQDYRISAIACYYATPLMWPLMIVLLAVGLFVTSQTGYEVMFEWHTRVAGERIDGWVVVLGLGLSVVIAALWFWWRRLHRGLGAVRYANV